jgi:hypothetical protein
MVYLCRPKRSAGIWPAQAIVKAKASSGEKLVRRAIEPQVKLGELAIAAIMLWTLNHAMAFRKSSAVSSMFTPHMNYVLRCFPFS